MINRGWSLVLLSGVVALSACKNENAAPVASTAAAVAADVVPDNVQPKVVVYKSATCGCCKAWIEHMQNHGFPVEVHDTDDLEAVKERVGIPAAMASCHTAEVGGYFIEGHVPATQVQRLLAEKPQAKGLTVPGMPIGSPGMEQEDRVDAYEVRLVHEDGSTSVYAEYPER